MHGHMNVKKGIHEWTYPVQWTTAQVWRPTILNQDIRDFLLLAPDKSQDNPNGWTTTHSLQKESASIYKSL